MERFSRTAALIGSDNIEKLNKSSVLIVGVGGVGAACAEAIARSGVGTIYLLDFDTVSRSNINRQILALESNIGRLKVDVIVERIVDINPDCKAYAMPIFLNEETIEEAVSLPVNYIIDCIDTVSSKLSLIETATKRGIPIISSMGTGNRLDPTQVTTGEIKDTSGHGCPLARIMRRELKKRDVHTLSVVFSKEFPTKTTVASENGRNPPASSAFVPNVAGYTLAYKVVSELIKE